jgi:hypothetical protein
MNGLSGQVLLTQSALAVHCAVTLSAGRCTTPGSG